MGKLTIMKKFEEKEMQIQEIKEEPTVKTEWDIRKYFEQLRFDKDHHLGMGDIRLTTGMQEEICELVERFYRCR